MYVAPFENSVMYSVSNRPRTVARSFRWEISGRQPAVLTLLNPSLGIQVDRIYLVGYFARSKTALYGVVSNS